MDSIPKRKISEIITLYSLHPEFRDIYVEGISDNLVIDSFLKQKGITNVKIYNIDDFDFSELYPQSPELKRNMKLKLVALSDQLHKCYTTSLKFVCLIVDRDFDDLSNVKYNSYILLTDFTDMEMYLFDERCIDQFYSKILHNFPFDGKATINELSGPLKELFLIRYAIKCLCKNPCDFIGIRNTCQIEKKTGKVNFDHVEYLKRMLNKLNQLGQKETYLQHIKETKSKLPKEIKRQIRGHDFTHLFFLYINNIKNNIKINEDTMGRVLFMCLNYEKLITYSLFKSLHSKYC